MSTDDNDATDGVDIDSGLLQPEDSLDDRGVLDVLDEGYSPPDRPWELNDYGLTAREAAEHESLNGRLARELPDIMIPDGDGLGDASDTDGELYDNEAGTARSGRLIDVEATGEIDDYAYLYAVDIGRDGGAASAEEAAVHIVTDEDEPEPV
jgi:Family of unknown function (DUF5709)